MMSLQGGAYVCAIELLKKKKKKKQNLKKVFKLTPLAFWFLRDYIAWYVHHTSEKPGFHDA